MKTEFESKPIYNKKSLKTKIKCYGYEFRDFNDKEILKVRSNCASLAIISINFVPRKE